MKRIVSISLLIVLSTGIFVNIGIYTWFQIDQAYIASELCENRFIPESDCGGHCVLEKKINAVETKKGVIVEFKLLSFLCVQSNEVLMENIGSTSLLCKPTGSFDYQYASAIFRPPIA